MDIEALETMLDRGQDGLLLRFALGQSMFESGQYEQAINHLNNALAYEPAHTASLKILGKAYTEVGNYRQALEVYARGIEIAEQNGDIQAAKEMKVFLRRLEKQPPG